MDPANKLLAIALTGPGIQVSSKGAVSDVENLISRIIGILTVVAVIWFVFQVIFAGYAMLSAQGDEKKIESARSRLTNGILGLTITIIAFGLGALLSNLMGLGNIFNLQSLDIWVK